jgi:Fe-S-cluster containining protein
MESVEKIRGVLKIFKRVDADVHNFKMRSGLSCFRQCCRCCVSKEVFVTILEVLPMAYWILKRDLQDEFIEKMESNPTAQCVLLKNHTKNRFFGSCLIYNLRPLICRMFGFSAILDKNGLPKLVTCQVIKRVFRHRFQSASNSLDTYQVPIMKRYYAMLYSIDYSVSHRYYPVNEALRIAFKDVGSPPPINYASTFDRRLIV